MKNIKKDTQSTDMNRREALKKAGKYAAFTALASMIILSPKQSQALSKPGGGWP